MEGTRYAFMKKYRNILLVILFVLLLLLGLWISLSSTIIDFQSSNIFFSGFDYPIILFHGISTHGIGFIRTFRWNIAPLFLTLIPFLYVFSVVIGIQVHYLIIFGWIIFVINSLLASIIIKKLVGNKFAFLALIFLLFASRFTLQNSFLSYFDHNVTVSYILLSLLFIINIFNEKRFFWVYVIILFILTSINVFSDPWFYPAFVLPILIMLIIFGFKNQDPISQNCRRLFIFILGGTVTGYTQFFGLFYFFRHLNSLPINNLHGLIDNMLTIKQDIPILFNIITPSFYLGKLLLLFYIFIIIALFFIILKSIKPFWKLLDSTKRFIIGFAVLSSLGTVSAFLIQVAPPGAINSYWVVRYFMNLYYFIPLIFIILISGSWQSIGKIGKKIIIGAYAGFIVMGIMNSPITWRGIIPTKRIAGMSFANFLISHDLRYGYCGHYRAYTITVASKFRTIVRPIIFDSKSHAFRPRPLNTATIWYEINNISRTHAAFLALTPSICNNITICLKYAKMQFGVPYQILYYKTIPILVWNNSLVKQLLFYKINNFKALSPILILQGYHGFNIISYRNKFYGLAQNEGAFNINKVTKKQYKQLFIGDSVDEVKSIIVKTIKSLKNYDK